MNLKDALAQCKKIKAAGKIPYALGFAGSTVGVSVLVVGGLVPAVVVVFAVIDALGAMWTAAALRSDRVAAAG